MQIIINFIQGILDMGAASMLPIMITILGLVFRMKFIDAFKCGLNVGIGFMGLNLILNNLLFTTLSPITDYYVAQGSGFTIIDAGWMGLAAAAWATPFAVILVPISFALNMVLFRIKFTKTINVDIWNYWHFLFTATLAYLASGNLVVGFITGLLCSVLVLKLSDWFAPAWQEQLGAEGTSCTTLYQMTGVLPIMLVLNKIIDHIPGLNRLDVSLETFHQKFGKYGDPAIVGFVVGAILAIVTRQPLESIMGIAVGIAASIILLPKMISMLMEGLTPIGKAAQEKVKKSFGEDADVIIGLDSAIACGDPIGITGSLVMIPITIIMCFTIPGIAFFPITGLATYAYNCGFASIVSKGNLFRTILLTAAHTLIEIFMCMYMASFITQAMLFGGFELTGLGANACAAQFINLIIVTLGNLFG